MPHTSLEFTNVDLGAMVETDDRPINHTIDHSVGIDIEAGEAFITIIDPIIDPTIGTDPETNAGMITEEIATSLVISRMILDKMVGGTISNTTVETDHLIEDMIQDKDIGIEVKVGIGSEIMIVIIPEVGVDIELDKQDQELELCQMTEEHPDHDPIWGLALIEID